MKIKILLFAFVAFIAASAPHARAEGPEIQTTSGIIFGDSGPVFVEIFHTGDPAAALEAVGAGDAEAYTHFDIKQTAPLEFHYNSRYRPIQDADVASAVAAWNGMSAFHASVVNKTTRLARNCDGQADDGFSVIDWGNVGNNSGNRIVAIACWHEPGECDIRIDPWAIDGLETKWYRGIITHEVGHCAGIGHSEDPGALMYPFISVTTPQQDDFRAIWSKYGQRLWFWR